MDANKLIIFAVTCGIFVTALLFCYAYGLNNNYVYMPLALYLGYKFSTSIALYFMPDLWDPPAAPEPKNRMERKRAAKDTQAFNKTMANRARRQEASSRRDD